MSTEGPQGQHDPQDPIGSAAEEAAKLFGALSDWAKGHGTEAASGFAGLAGHAAAAAQGLGTEVNDHLATGAAECTYCPICRTVHVIREVSPEVREHLATAAASLMQAFAGLLTATVTHAGPPRDRATTVEKINLDTTEWPET